MNQNPGPVNATTRKQFEYYLLMKLNCCKIVMLILVLQTLSNRPQTQNKLPGPMTMGPGGQMNQGPPLRQVGPGPMGQGPMMQNPNAVPIGNQMGQGASMPMPSVMGGPPMQSMPVQGMPGQGMPGQQGMPGVVPGNIPPNSMGRMQPRKVCS